MMVKLQSMPKVLDQLLWHQVIKWDSVQRMNMAHQTFMHRQLNISLLAMRVQLGSHQSMQEVPIWVLPTTSTLDSLQFTNLVVWWSNLDKVHNMFPTVSSRHKESILELSNSNHIAQFMELKWLQEVQLLCKDWIKTLEALLIVHLRESKDTLHLLWEEASRQCLPCSSHQPILQVHWMAITSRCRKMALNRTKVLQLTMPPLAIELQMRFPLQIFRATESHQLVVQALLLLAWSPLLLIIQALPSTIQPFIHQLVQINLKYPTKMLLKVTKISSIAHRVHLTILNEVT